MEKIYSRHIAKVIERQANKKPVIIITGARQVGKSTLLKKLLPNTQYITLDNPILRAKANENTASFMEEYRPPIIIDEIQKAKSLFEYVKINVDENLKSGQYFLTGSQRFNLMKGVSESLAGRTGIINMFGLSKREFNEIDYTAPFVPTKTHREAMKRFQIPYNYMKIMEIIHKGSFPELYKTETTLADWNDYHTSYLQTYLEKDITGLVNANNITAFVKFIKAVAALSGEQLNLVTLAEICGMNQNTAKNWLSILETSGLVYLLQPYSNNLNKRLIKTPKLYFLDTGLLCFLTGWNTARQMIDGARFRHIFETYIIGEILKSYYNDGIIYPPLYYYRDKDKNEVDLLIENGDTIYPVEIKATADPTNTMVKSFEILKKIPAKTIGEGGLICTTKYILPLDNNAWTIPVDMV